MTTLFFIFILIISACSTNNNNKASQDSELLVGDTKDDEYIRIPVSEVSDQMTKHTYSYNGININFFTVIGSDGEIRTAFDACDVCGGHKGYRQQGADVVCNNCGRVFSIDSIGTENKGGGCWPSYLEHDIVEGNVLVKKADLARESYKFA